jgi:hypothetical protein
MAEEIESPESGAQAAGIDPAAMALALGGASRAEADAFLKDQRRLIAEQRHHLSEQFKQLRLGIWQMRLGVLLRLGTAAVGFAVAAAFAFMVWDASRSNGLLVEPFSVPADLAARGFTGEVVATKLLDSLLEMQSQTRVGRTPRTYANSWAENAIRLDIPETGVSLTELDHFLRQKFGRDTHVSGEIVHLAAGLVLTARADEAGAASASGAEADFDGLIRQLAESVYRLTQPYRYGVYLANHDRVSEAAKVFEALATTGPAQERPWGYIGWASVLTDRDPDTAFRLGQRASALQPDNISANVNLLPLEEARSLPEECLRNEKNTLSLFSGDNQYVISANQVPVMRSGLRGIIAMDTGAFLDAIPELQAVVQSGLVVRASPQAHLAWAQTAAHDLAAARLTMAQPDSEHGVAGNQRALVNIQARMHIAAEAENWGAVRSQQEAVATLIRSNPGSRLLSLTVTTPILALAQAKLGDIAAAEAGIAPTPADCYICLITRARIAALRGQRGRADYWFARAVNAAPSIPFAYVDWGEALLARGDLDGAIAKFIVANQKGPHFADPLELWGEALMAQKHPDTALEKFAEAEKYAPNWGRLHLKWGEALAAAGKHEDARAQFARAAQLDLTPADRAELVKERVHS